MRHPTRANFGPPSGGYLEMDVDSADANQPAGTESTCSSACPGNI